jgi:hypothetical protein
LIKNNFTLKSNEFSLLLLRYIRKRQMARSQIM